VEQTPSKILHRLMIVIPIIFLIGFLIFFLKDKFVGAAFIVGGGITLGWGMFYYYKVKKDDPLAATRSLAFFNILGGVVILGLSLAVFLFEKESFNNVIYDAGLGIMFLIYGIFKLKRKQTPETTWKEIPLGMKMIVVFLLITILLNVRGLSNLQQANFLFGFYIQPPLSTILGILFLIIPIAVIFLIYQKREWKLILGLQSLNLLNVLLSAIKILFTPLPQLFAMVNEPLPNGSAEVLQATELQSKLIVSIPLTIGIVIAVFVLIYIYRKREYFSND